MKLSIGKLKQAAVITGMTLSGIGGIGAITPANALTFNFTTTNTSLDPLALQGFVDAGKLWSSLFTDNVNININIDFSNLGTSTLAQAGSYYDTFSYTTVYNALVADRSSTDDNTAVSSLSANPTFNMLINHTANNVGSGTPYLDNNGSANNSTININTANAKALGLTAYTGPDADITFNNNNQFSWDFNRGNGITAGAYDFVGIAAHEIGHSLGFVSGVDDLANSNYTAGLKDENLFTLTPLDLFRYSALSNSNGNSRVIDFTADARDKYLSLDGGVTKIASFSTGEIFGDGRQASHFKDTLTPNTASLGIMDPTSGAGELLLITENDLKAFDAIGWNRAVVSNNATAVPEPENFIGTLIFAAFGTKMVLKRRQKLSESSSSAK